MDGFHPLLLFLLLCFAKTKTTAMRGNDAKSHSMDEKETKNSLTRSVKGDKDGHRAVFLFSQKWPSRLSGDNFLRRVRKITKRPTTTTQCKIFCRSGYHLEILPNGMVRGTVDQESKYVLFEMQSFGPSLVKLMGITTGRYLVMRRNGTLHGLRNRRSRDSLFKETHEQNAFHSYASHRFYRKKPYDMLVGIKRNGQIKRATKTVHGQTATQFLVIKL
ncbi:fibroblast growth factor 16-like [Acropora millepora]|uniref:fibroblast growth factor 16-like n=1 Tax=Acropora millepora TaxID=45264 RepID=UPI001CF1F27E|nr:fibroblast growth factor 16-like [Acropora millepora]XP_044178280.1 fibroblast growth factor 16-like [Acropora millepora]XP_044178281.1 fibroblast growth factor 16-like [Acropora millepora]XP_044178282.1 fibroblast growth factor 16-like [Acropora millepora]XP_044178283.1 fibroblast growth factor 16-like [Acropora millepora]XP_044178284.1 fibroblast growth factor 16-like [Acropora millepora]